MSIGTPSRPCPHTARRQSCPRSRLASRWRRNEPYRHRPPAAPPAFPSLSLPADTTASHATLCSHHNVGCSVRRRGSQRRPFARGPSGTVRHESPGRHRRHRNPPEHAARSPTRHAYRREGRGTSAPAKPPRPAPVPPASRSDANQAMPIDAHV